MITTRSHSISPGIYSSRLMVEWVSRHWWAIALPVMPCIVAGFYDLRFFIVTAAWLLIVSPGILALVYFRYALSPEAARMTLPHTVTFSDRDIIISWPETEYRDEIIPYSKLKKVEDTGSALVIAVAGTFLPIIIPVKEFESSKDIVTVMSLLNEPDK